ncbi:MAG: hypothetical protein K2J78_05175 [Muribaculaceae bacterium]|nr:hypothetical protein [Muribaculaceae bacterium]
MLVRIIIYILLVVLLAACKEKNDPRLDLWEEQMLSAPDSILTVLEDTDPAALSTDYDRARYPLLLMMARDKCYLPLQPDSALNQATEYFHKKKDLLNEAKARYYAGLAERHAGNYQQAIWETLNAIDRAHEAADTFWMGRAHDLAYEIYMATYDCRNAAIEADNAAIHFKRAGAVAFHRYALLEKAQALNLPVYEDNTPVGRGMFLLDSLKNIALTDQDFSLAASCIYNKIVYYYRAKDYKTTRLLTDSIILLSQDAFLRHELLPIMISQSLSYGEQPIELLKEYSMALTTRQDSMNYIHKQREISVATNNWHRAYELADSLLSYYEIILGEKTFKSLDEVTSNYHMQLLSAKQKESESLQRTKIWISCASGGGILVLILVIVLIRTHNKRKEENLMSQLAVIASENKDLKDRQVQIGEKVSNEIESLKTKIQSQESLESENSQLKQQLRSQADLTTEINSLKEELDTHKDVENTLRLQKDFAQDNMVQLSLNRASLLGNRIDTLCEMAMEYYGCDDNDSYKNEIYHRVLKELKQLKSERFLKELESRIDHIHRNILTRFQEQLPVIAKGNIMWFALSIGGLQPRTISFLLDMKIQTLYSKRLRVRSYIEKSDAPDKKEFLLFFPKTK